MSFGHFTFDSISLSWKLTLLFRHIFYLPFYFQAVKGTTAEGSGIRSIPYLVSITLASIVVGGLITAFGWYTPFMWFGAAIFTVGAGMLQTLKVDSSAGRWIGYQILAGVGAGAGVQIPFVAVQVVLGAKDMPTGSTSHALLSFCLPDPQTVLISSARSRCSSNLLQLPRWCDIHLHRPKHLLQHPHPRTRRPNIRHQPRAYHRRRRHSRPRDNTTGSISGRITGL